jgi:two-component system chemotaxis response regulator CheB
MASKRKFGAVAIGVSSGGVQALKLLLGELPRDFPLPILIVQHISPDAGGGMAKLLDDLCAIQVKEADEQDRILPSTVYLAPPNYHLLVEREGFRSLSADPPVSYARPSVDVLFESAAAVFGPELIAIVLTGANWDGARGVQAVKQRGGIVIVQDPADADTPQMPQAAIAAVEADHVVPLAAMPGLLQRLAGTKVPEQEGEAGHA